MISYQIPATLLLYLLNLSLTLCIRNPPVFVEVCEEQAVDECGFTKARLSYRGKERVKDHIRL